MSAAGSFATAASIEWVQPRPLSHACSATTVPVNHVAVAVVSVCWFAHDGWKSTRLTEENVQVAKVAAETIAEEGIRREV